MIPISSSRLSGPISNCYNRLIAWTYRQLLQPLKRLIHKRARYSLKEPGFICNTDETGVQGIPEMASRNVSVPWAETRSQLSKLSEGLDADVELVHMHGKRRAPYRLSTMWTFWRD